MNYIKSSSVITWRYKIFYNNALLTQKTSLKKKILYKLVAEAIWTRPEYLRYYLSLDNYSVFCKLLKKLRTKYINEIVLLILIFLLILVWHWYFLRDNSTHLLRPRSFSWCSRSIWILKINCLHTCKQNIMKYDCRNCQCYLDWMII